MHLATFGGEGVSAGKTDARPMPFDPPVTSTDLPLSPRSIE
jgi:hypothetical protein